MIINSKPNLLINLSDDFFKTEQPKGAFDYLGEIANVRRRSHKVIDEIMVDLKWADAVIMCWGLVLTDDVLDNVDHLQFIGQINTTQRCVKAALKHNIVVSEARHCWSPSVAEFALGLILSGLRKISDYHADMRIGVEIWFHHGPSEFPPLERQLTGRSVGIIGFGGIGRRLAQLLVPFNVKLSVYDPYLLSNSPVEFSAKLLPLDDVIKNSEIIVLCAASNKGSVKIIGKEQIEMMRKDCLLVNVARAAIIDMDALQKRLEKNDMTAMLDVFDIEPLDKNSPLRKLKNVYLSPHRAGGILESVERAISMLSYDFEAYFKGEQMKYAVTADMLQCFSD